MATEIKRRTRKPKSDVQKTLDAMRKISPKHVVEVELLVTDLDKRKLPKIQEHLRVIRNTVLGQLDKHYRQMIRTKAHKRLSKQYFHVCEKLEKAKDDKERIRLGKEQKQLKEQFEKMQKRFYVTFEYCRKYGERLREIFSLPDAVTVLSVCEWVWKSIESRLYNGAEKSYFYKKTDLITLQGKQASKCIILKYDEKKNTFYARFNGMKFSLIVKKNDLFIQETLAHVAYYMKNSGEIDGQNMERYRLGQPLLPSYRICNNRIVTKEIRGKKRYYLQMVLEGTPVPKRKKDGSLRHSYRTGRIGGDVGTQTLAIVSEKEVHLKNLAERSDRSLEVEHKIYSLQRYIDRSMRAMNPQNYNKNGTIKKGKKEWVFSNKCLKAKQKLRDLHRKTAESRKYAHNEEVNRLRSIGDVLLVETMNFKGLQRKAKEVTKNEHTGKFNRRKRFGKSIGKRSPAYLIKQAKYRFELTGGTVKEVNTWTFKASQYDHMTDEAKKKTLSKRWHTFEDGTKVQRDLYSAFLLYCAEDDLQSPSKEKCEESFPSFLELHNQCMEEIKRNGKRILNCGIKIS
ncbi:MAG: hypothetical protein ACE3JP_04085 [Ectobacillus sp.]